MSKTYTAFKAYDKAGSLRLVGSGPAPIGAVRWEIDRVETFTFPTSNAALAFILAETPKIAK